MHITSNLPEAITISNITHFSTNYNYKSYLGQSEHLDTTPNPCYNISRNQIRCSCTSQSVKRNPPRQRGFLCCLYVGTTLSLGWVIAFCYSAILKWNSVKSSRRCRLNCSWTNAIVQPIKMKSTLWFSMADNVVGNYITYNSRDYGK